VVDGTTFLVTRHEKDEQSPQGTVTTIEKYSEYTDISGVKLPKKIQIQNSIFSMDLSLTYSVNETVDPSTFEPPKH
jgi:hypothetical protein